MTSFFDSKFDFFLSGLAYLEEEVDIAQVEGDVEQGENEKVVQPFGFWRPHSTVPPASNAEKEKSIWICQTDCNKGFRKCEVEIYL